jgi:hypothetical protein
MSGSRYHDPDWLNRLHDHDGNFAVSRWVACEACVKSLTTIMNRRQPGWYAIPHGTPHRYDPVTNTHLHTACADALKAAAEAQRRATNEHIYTNAVRSWFKETA